MDLVQQRYRWTRGILQSEFGVRPEDMVWYQERGENFSHTGASRSAGLKLPDNIELHYAAKDFNTMFLEGELDATTGLGVRKRRAVALSGYGEAAHGLARARSTSEEPDLIPLFPDIMAEAKRFFKKTGIYPPHHCTVIRESILEEHPWVAVSLMEAFEEAKKRVIEQLNRQPPSLLVFGQHYLRDLDETFGTDPFPYGVKVNAKAFDMAQTFSVEQGLTEKKQPFEEIFPEEVIISEERL